MRALWMSSLALSLGFLVTSARGEEVVWRQASPLPPTGAASAPAPSTAPVAELQRPIARAAAPAATAAPVAALGRPVASAGPSPAADQPTQPVAFSQTAGRAGPISGGKSREAQRTRP